MTATWTTPRTWTAGELVTASIMNTHVRDNLDWLKTPIAAIDLASSVSTTSASLTDVTGSSVTFTSTGGGFDVFWMGVFSVNGVATVTFALDIDGATEFSFNLVTSTSGQLLPCPFPYHVGAKAAGSHTFKMRVATNANTVSVTGYQMYVVERGA
jgi:hypothetical protein